MSVIVVVSGVNLIEGGTLEVLKDCINAFARKPNVKLICLVNSVSLFDQSCHEGVQFIEFPDVKRSWLKRLRFEYFSVMALSRKLKADIWFSMHDMSPRVIAGKQYVYCHNPSPFYKAGVRELLLDKKFFLFSNFYKYLYRLNIRSNAAVIVQQGWMVPFFKRLAKKSQVWVARPTSLDRVPQAVIPALKKSPEAELKLFYPALPRSFKNFEIVFRALESLSRHKPEHAKKVSVTVTIAGDENNYARWLKHEFGGLPNIVWAGRMTRSEVDNSYQRSNVVVFPSRLETWGLPITEAKSHGKPVLLADLPYAHETLGDYSAAAFFDPTDAAQLAEQIVRIIDGEPVFSAAQQEPCIADALLNSWEELVEKMLLATSQSRTAV